MRGGNGAEEDELQAELKLTETEKFTNALTWANEVIVKGETDSSEFEASFAAEQIHVIEATALESANKRIKELEALMSVQLDMVNRIKELEFELEHKMKSTGYKMLEAANAEIEGLKVENETNRRAAANGNRRVQELESRVVEFEVIKQAHLEILEELKTKCEVYEAALEECKNAVDTDYMLCENDNDEKEYWVSHSMIESIVDQALSDAAKLKDEK